MSEQNARIRILHLEDSPSDAEVISELLEATGMCAKPILAANREQFEEALEKGNFDLIICDFNLPGFDGLSALKLAKSLHPEIPLIIVSGPIDPEAACECLRAGATDYLLKQRLERLPSAVDRAMEEVSTRKKRAEAELRLRESEARFRQLADLSNEGFWFSTVRPLRFEYISPAIEKIWGIPAEALYQNDEARSLAIHPDDRQSEHEAREACITGANARFDVEYRVIQPDGSERWVMDCGTAIRNEAGDVVRMSGVIRDITERRRVEETLQASHARMAEQATMLSSVRDAVIARDLDQRIFYWNAGAERLYGWTSQEAFGRRANDLLRTEANTSASMEGVLATGEWRGELRNRSKDGRNLLVESFRSLMSDASGKPAGILSIDTDITKRKQAELARIESEQFARASLDALNAHVAILNDHGIILAVNSAWRRFAASNGGEDGTVSEGANYLDICSRSHGKCSDEAPRIASGIRSVIRGEAEELVLEYPCHSPTEQRWFQCRVTRFPGNGPVRVAVAHENVTLVKQVRDQLDESHEMFRTLARVAPAGIFRFSEAGLCNYVNHHWCIMTGFSEEDTFGHGWSLAVHPEDRSRILESWTDTVIRHQPFHTECRLLKRNGAVIWVILQAVELTGADGRLLGYVGTAFNITVQKQTESVLRMLSTEGSGLTPLRFYQLVVRRLAETVGIDLALIGRMDGQRQNMIKTLAVWADDKIQENFSYNIEGTPCENVVGKSLSIHPSGVQRQFPRDEAMAKNGIVSYAGIPLNDASGRPLGLLCIMSRTPLRDPPQTEAILKLFAVRTAAEIERQEAISRLERTASELSEAKAALEVERAQLADRVTERTLELSEANADLERANRLKSEFLANMSHELRTPLNAILGLSEAMLEQIGGTLTPRQVRSATTIHASGQHLLALINDILDLSKIEAGKLELQRDLVNVNDVCHSSMGLVKAQAAKKQITIAFENTERIAGVHADPKRLKQILVNLLTNAVKFTPEGGRTGLIVSTAPDASGIRFSVWDTGIGITPEDAHKLFSAFTQIDSGLSRAQEGTGLGLALVAKLADAHGGSVSLESEPGRGSTFTLTLPHPGTDAGGPGGTESAPAPKPRRALIVEDDSDMSEMLQNYLADLGFQSKLIERGDHAIAEILRERPDLVLLDLELPGESGLDVLRYVKAHPQAHDIPILVVTGVNDPEKSRSLGAVGHLTKPFTKAGFLHFVGQSLTRSASPAAPLVPRPTRASGPLILLAEDNDANIETIGGYLDQIGYQMKYAPNGVAAVRIARELRPALILMDIQMPVLDGMSAIREIRADAGLKHIPIIALTGLAMPGDRERCLATGADAYFSKPVCLRDLSRHIRRTLKQADLE